MRAARRDRGVRPAEGRCRPEDLDRLDAALARWAEVAERDIPGAPAGLVDLPGAGAAGGLGAALLALGGTRRSGGEMIFAAVDLPRALAEADLVLTGEGSFDFQSVRGKVAGGVAKAATAHGVPCLVLAGQVSLGRTAGGGRRGRGGVLGGRAGRLRRGRDGAPGRPPGRARRARGRGVEPQVGLV